MAVKKQCAVLQILTRDLSLHDVVQAGLHGKVIAFKKFNEQFLLAAKIRIERATRITCGQDDFFNVSGDKPFIRKDDLRCIKQTLARLFAGLLAGESFAVHVCISTIGRLEKQVSSAVRLQSSVATPLSLKVRLLAAYGHRRPSEDLSYPACA